MRVGAFISVGGHACAEKSSLKQPINLALLSTCGCRKLRTNPVPAPSEFAMRTHHEHQSGNGRGFRLFAARRNRHDADEIATHIDL